MRWGGAPLTRDEKREWVNMWNAHVTHPDFAWVKLQRPRVKGPAQTRKKKFSSSNKLRVQVFPADDFTCRDCLTEFPHSDPYFGEPIRGLTLGHIVARSNGGSDTPDNLMAQCSQCNNDLGSNNWTPGWRDARIDPDAR